MMKLPPSALAGALLVSLVSVRAAPAADGAPSQPQGEGAASSGPLKRLSQEERSELRRQLADFHRASRTQ